MKKCLLLSLLLFPAAATAQTDDNAAVMERMDRMDHDIQLLQRQIARGETPTGDTAAPAPAGAEAQVSGIEDEIRSLRGKIEENQFQIKKLSDDLAKLQRDTDFRFNDLKNGAASATATAMPGIPLTNAPPLNLAQPPAATAQPEAAAAKAAAPAATGEPDANAAEETPPAGAASEAAPQSFATPRDHYNYAFRLLGQTQYDEAAKSFDSFTKKYPKDPLVGNAYYWEGETYYIRHDYVNAADDFRQGFESAPDGPKAADNLLKLAMSENALNRDKEACLILQQITTKYKKSPGNTLQKAEQEQKRMNCQ